MLCALFYLKEPCEVKPTIVPGSWKSYDSRFVAQKALELFECDGLHPSGGYNFWLGKPHSEGKFEINLGCYVTVTGVTLKNTQNGPSRNS